MEVALIWTEPPEGGVWDEGKLRATVTTDDGPTVEIELFGFHQPQVTAVTVRKQAGVVSRDLRLPLAEYLNILGERFGVGRHQVAPPDRRRGRAHPDAFLQKVADAYRAAGNSIAGLTPEIDAAFTASDSTKYRWVRAARERNLLEPREG